MEDEARSATSTRSTAMGGMVDGDRARLPAARDRRERLPVPAGRRAQREGHRRRQRLRATRTRRRCRSSTSTRRRPSAQLARLDASCARRATTAGSRAALDALRDAARGTGNTMPPLLDARARLRDGRRDVRRAARGLGRVRGSADQSESAVTARQFAVGRWPSAATQCSLADECMQDPSGHRQAGPRRPRPRREGHRARAARRRHGSDLHRPAPDARADRRRPRCRKTPTSSACRSCRARTCTSARG